MQNCIKHLFLLLITLLAFNSYSQCDYDTSSVQITHLNCFEIATGEIDLNVPNVNASFNWEGPIDLNNNTQFISTNIPITGLFSGDYILTISEYSIPGDITSSLICQMTDTFRVDQTNDISATYEMKNNCNSLDSADVIINVSGGTPYNAGELYNYDIINSLLNNIGSNDTILNIPSGVYTLNITDKNGCEPSNTQSFEVPIVNDMQSFMSSIGVACKDDNNGEVRVFVQNGTPPFVFDWGEEFPIIEHDSFSVINDLLPEIYNVSITDSSGCIIMDSIEVASNANNCLNIYKVFSPNDDDTNEFWEIENIDLYPKAIISVYSRDGREVYRRRNYVNIENIAFAGKNKNGQPLPSGVYYYIISLENEDEVLKGTVSIIR